MVISLVLRPIINPEKFIDIDYDAYNYIDESVSNTDKAFLATAAKLALTSNNRFKMAAIVVKSGRVLGGDINLNKISPFTPPNRFSTHAEIRAMKVARRSQPSGSTIYVARIDANESPALARPCAWCVEHMQTMNINKVVFTITQDESSSFYLNTVTWNNHLYE
jgi:tRNA(Arg) A34 adenosine deaminase TadA